MTNERNEDKSIYQKSKSNPGVYEYRSDVADEMRQTDARLWNEEAVQKLDQLYDRLDVPKRLRR